MVKRPSTASHSRGTKPPRWRESRTGTNIIFSGNFRKGNHTPLAVVCRPPSAPTFCSFLWESTHARSLSHARVRVAKTLPSISVLKKRSVETQFGTSFRKVSFLKLYAAKGDFFETIITLKEKKTIISVLLSVLRANELTLFS